jgi:hypothetical protein
VNAPACGNHGDGDRTTRSTRRPAPCSRRRPIANNGWRQWAATFGRAPPTDGASLRSANSRRSHSRLGSWMALSLGGPVTKAGTRTANPLADAPGLDSPTTVDWSFIGSPTSLLSVGVSTQRGVAYRPQPNLHRSARLTYGSSQRRSPRRRSDSWPRLSRRRSAQRRSVITLTVGSAANWDLKR